MIGWQWLIVEAYFVGGLCFGLGFIFGEAKSLFRQ